MGKKLLCVVVLVLLAIGCAELQGPPEPTSVSFQAPTSVQVPEKAAPQRSVNVKPFLYVFFILLLVLAVMVLSQSPQKRTDKTGWLTFGAKHKESAHEKHDRPVRKPGKKR